MQETVLNGESMNIVEDNIEKLKSIFPDVFTEGKVDFDKLQDVLGNYIEKKEERYNFTWNGKSAALRLAQTPSTGTLRPCKKESKDWDTTENLYIEGDNLEVLKLLQKSYHNKIKMIYIDPPYNTGGDFVYPDDFKDNLDNYKKITGQIDSEGNKISSNTESDGRYHTNWLNMMYPRLRLARNLLSDNGVIFISIDDNEITNLRKLCDEIFGVENFIAQMTREAIKGGSQSKYIRITHDYVLIYAKNINEIEFGGIEVEGIKLNLKDEKGAYAKGRELNKWGAGSRREDSPSMWFPIKGPNGEDVYPIRNDGSEGRWRLGKEKMHQIVENGDVIFEKRENGTYIVYEKIRDDSNRIKQFISILKDDYINAKGTEDIKKLFNIERSYFDYAKPVNLVKDLLIMSNVQDNDIVLDFFSGSATTAHAVLQLNKEDNNNRKFIMVQIPEITAETSEAYKAGYKNICQIGEDRIRRAGNKIKEEIESGNTQLKLGEEPKNVPDIGFKVFKLDTSNIKKWNGNADTIESEIQSSIFNYEVGRSELDVVYEIMLKCGLDLTYPIEEINVNGKTLYSIGAGAMFVCMDDNITQDIADKIVEIKDANDIVEPVAVFKDNGFTTDSNKTNIKETLRVAGIKDFITV